jgi:hypothetical protein
MVTCRYYYYYYYYYFSCHSPILPGNSLEATMIPTAQAVGITVGLLLLLLSSLSSSLSSSSSQLLVFYGVGFLQGCL